MKRIWYYMILGLAIFWQMGITASAKTVIAIDPGHGGSNEGAEYLKNPSSNIREKDLTLELAQLLEAELEKYDDIEVILLRNSDIDISLQERAALASRYNAQWIISLHFNESEQHNYYGAELWIPAETELYRDSFLMAQEIETQLLALGLNSRGIKTRLKSNNIENYYGIIRESSNLGISTILVEHCFVDAENDTIFWCTPNALEKLAKADADGIISYIHEHTLSTVSTIYPDNWNSEGALVKPDTTPPIINNIEFGGIFDKTATFSMEINEPESRLSYYDYSTDGGITWSSLLPWPQEQNALHIQNAEKDQKIVFRIYNGYDLYSESDVISMEQHSDILDVESVYKEQIIYEEGGHWENHLLLEILLFALEMEICLFALSLYITQKAFWKTETENIFSSYSMEKAKEEAMDIAEMLQKSIHGEQVEEHPFIKSLKTDLISHSIISEKLNMDKNQTIQLCHYQKLHFPKDTDVSTKMIQLMLNLTYTFDYLLENYDKSLNKRFLNKIYYMLGEHQQWDLKYDWDMILKESENYPAVSKEKEEEDDLLYLLNLYMEILSLMKNHLFACEFANLIVLKECLNMGIAPFILAARQVKNILNSEKVPKKALRQYAIEQQAEFILTFWGSF